MMRLLQRLRPTGSLRRAHLSLAAVSVILAMAFYAGVMFVQTWMDKELEIDRLGTAVRQLDKRLSLVQSRSADPETREALGRLGPFAASVADAEAHAQTVLRTLTALPDLAGVQLENVHPLPPVGEAGLRAVRISASLSVSSASVFELVNALEASTRSLLIDSIRIVSRPNSGSNPNVPSRASVQVAFRVYGQMNETAIAPVSIIRGKK